MHDATLLDLFSQDIGHATRLLELIDLEYQALGERDLERLQGLLTDKQPLLALLAQHATQRSRVLDGLHLSADRAGLEQLAQGSALGAELLTQGDALNELFKRCQTANLRNGQLIRSNQAATVRMLNILRGGDTPNLYDSRGSAAKISGQRFLSQA